MVMVRSSKARRRVRRLVRRRSRPKREMKGRMAS